MRVSLAPRHLRQRPCSNEIASAKPWLAREGALVVLGGAHVMAWRGFRVAIGASFDFVFGQVEAFCVDHGRGLHLPALEAVDIPYGPCAAAEHLIVADAANFRLLGFDLDRSHFGAGATRLPGPRSFGNSGDNRWRAAARDTQCWPYGESAVCSVPAVADCDNDSFMPRKFSP